MLLQDKIVIITGIGPGMGRKLALEASKAGAKLVLAARSRDFLESVAREVEAAGGAALAVTCDVSRKEDCARIVAAAIDKFGRIDGLVNSAYGSGSFVPFEEADLDDWRTAMNVTLFGSLQMIKEVLPHMKAQGGGSIVNVTSISGLQGLPVAHTYTAAKGAVINLTRSIGITYCDQKIRANCIAPGFIDTPMVASVLGLFDDPAMADRLTPMKRPGTAEEMAFGCLYLASDEASYCQGTVLVIDGGTTARQ